MVWSDFLAIFTAELLALKMALNIVKNCNGDRFNIFNDSIADYDLPVGATAWQNDMTYTVLGHFMDCKYIFTPVLNMRALQKN